MPPSARDYAGRRRDSVWERELAQELRTLPEAERLAFIQDLAPANVAVAMDLARKCLTERASFEALLVQALNEAGASGVRYWLDAIVPHLGYRRVVDRLKGLAPLKPEGVRKAAYWLPTYEGQQGYFRPEDLFAMFDEEIDPYAPCPKCGHYPLEHYGLIQFRRGMRRAAWCRACNEVFDAGPPERTIE